MNVRNDENGLQYMRGRRMTMRTILWVAILVCLLTEAGFFIVYRYIEQSLPDDAVMEYILQYIIKPTGMNLISALAYYPIEAFFKKEWVKNFAMLTAVSVICFDLAYVHCSVPSLLCLYIMPVFLSVMFANKKLIASVTFLNIILFALTVFMTTNEISGLDFDGYYANVLVCFVVLICAYIFANILADYEIEARFLAATNQKRQNEIFEQVKRDPLTGLYNQKIFYDTLSVAMMQCYKVCVAVIDIDNFKSVNDTYGHATGDIVLIKLSDLLKNISGKSVVTARYGGEEFSVIFKDMDVKAAFEVMEKLRKEFSGYKFEQMNNSSVTFSCGITGPYSKNDSAVEFFDEADQALYYAKSHGKNRTIIYSDIHEEKK